MSREQFAHFGPGNTYFGIGGTPVDDYGTSDPKSSLVEGYEYEDNDYDWSYSGGRRLLGYELVRRRAVRNVSGGTLNAKDMVKFEAGQHFGKRISGQTGADEAGYPLDEFLVNGLPNLDIGWIVVSGRATCRLPAASAQVIAYGDQVRSAGSGRVKAHTTFTQPTDSTTTQTMASQMLNRVGFSRTSLASGNDGANVTVKVRRWD